MTLAIDNVLITKVTGLAEVPPLQCDALGFPGEQHGVRMLGFLDNDRLAGPVLGESRIAALFVREEHVDLVSRSGKLPVCCDDPRWHFFTLRNHLSRIRNVHGPSQIASSARIHPRAYVSDSGVTIGQRCIVEPNATVLEGTHIGDDVIVRANAVLGAEGFEHKRTSRGLLSVVHDGGVKIGNRVEIGAGTCVDRGFHGADTEIGDDTRVDNLVHIAHSVRIGQRVLIIAGAMLGGSCTVGDDCWIGPHVNVRNGIAVGRGAYLTMGAIVTRAVPPGERISGFFGVSHELFLKFVAWQASGAFMQDKESADT